MTLYNDGFAVVTNSGALVQHLLKLPARVSLPNNVRLNATQVGDQTPDGAYRVVERKRVRRPDGFAAPGTETQGLVNGAWVVDPNWQSADLATVRAELIVKVKLEANTRIVAVLPEWRQRNLTAQAAQLAAIKVDRAWTAEEQAAWNAGLALWAQVAAIRSHSDALEAEINAATLETLTTWTSHGWPA